MEKSNIIKLTVVLYRVTELFPKREPLKFSLRKKANDILAGFVLCFGNNSAILTKADKQRTLNRILKNIEVVQTFFSLAESQDWLRPENFLVLKREYGSVAQQTQQALIAQKEVIERESATREPITRASEAQEPVKRETPVRRQQTSVASASSTGLKSRHKQIIKFVKSKGAAQVKDVKEILPEVTKRTLRRDFDFLLKSGLVERRGDKNTTEYLVKPR